MNTLAETKPEVLQTRLTRAIREELDGIQDAPFVVGLCGGRSIEFVLAAFREILPELPESKRSGLQFFVIDERRVPIDAPESNFRLLNDGLFAVAISQRWIRESQVHPFMSKETSPDKGTADYFKALSVQGGRFHLVFCGVGEDGHIAGLFPHHRALSDSQPNFVWFDDSPKPPHERMSATRPLLEAADAAFAFFLGGSKASALSVFRDSSADTSSCPARILLKSKKVTVVTDLL